MLLKCVSDDDQTRKVSEGRKGEKKNNRELEKLNLRREKKKKKKKESNHLQKQRQAYVVTAFFL